MAFESILAQEPAVEALKRALRSGRVHHAYRFEGPSGVGKELTALAFAQSLLCEGDGPLACNRCRACERAVTFSNDPPLVPRHPDLLLVAKGLYPPAVLGTTHAETTSIGIEQVRRLVLARVGYPPHEGRAIVCIVRDAEELSTQAANALLKTVEEPGDRMYFVLLTSRPDQLPDTLRSRTLAVRFGRLPDSVIETLLQRHGAPTEVAALAQGSMSLALQLAEPEQMQTREAFVRAILEAIAADDLATALESVETRAMPRDTLREHLGYLAHALAERSREAVRTEGRQAERAAHQYQNVLVAMRELTRNAQPALVLEALMTRLRSA